MHTVLGIDLGTQSLKVLFYDFAAKKVVASESAALDLYQNDDGAAEQQAHWWTRGLQEALGRVDERIRHSAIAIAVSGQQHGFVPLNEAGDVLSPVKLWCDTSTTTECEEIMQAFGGPQACLEQAGNLILPGYTASKVRWLAKNRPGLYAQMDCILLPHDYLNFCLTGERCMEMGDASGTGFLDVRERTWSPGMLRAIDQDRDLSACLPRLYSEVTVIGKVVEEAASQFGLPAGIPVATGGGDNMMGAIGTGNLSAGKVTMSLGTSGTVYAHADQPAVDMEGDIAAFCSSDGAWLPLLCTMNCTVTTELMRRLLGSDLSAFEQQISQSPRGADGVITLPFFNGERTPNLPRAKACIFGLDSHNSQPANLLRSAVEGATFALRYGIDRLQSLGIETDEIVLTGGGANSTTWRQVVADICNSPVTILRQDEGASFGAALQALSVIEGELNLRLLAEDHLSRKEEWCCDPNPSAAGFYQESYQKYQRAVSAITPLYT